MRAVLAGPAARRALARTGMGAVEVPLRRGAYVRLGDELVMVVPHRAPVGPLTLLVAGMGTPDWAEGTPARADGGRLVIGTDAIGVGDVPAWDAPAPVRWTRAGGPPWARPSPRRCRTPSCAPGSRR
ncbi:MAG: hypothetical protein U0237_12865 [Thermoleophilia bacterium]